MKIPEQFEIEKKLPGLEEQEQPQSVLQDYITMKGRPAEVYDFFANNFNEIKKSIEDKNVTFSNLDAFNCILRCGLVDFYSRWIIAKKFSVNLDMFFQNKENIKMILPSLRERFTGHTLLNSLCDQLEEGHMIGSMDGGTPLAFDNRMISLAGEDYEQLPRVLAANFDEASTRKKVAEELGFPQINDISTREYYAFVNFVFDDYSNSIKLVKQGIQLFGEDFFRLLFLSLNKKLIDEKSMKFLSQEQNLDVKKLVVKKIADCFKTIEKSVANYLFKGEYIDFTEYGVKHNQPEDRILETTKKKLLKRAISYTEQLFSNQENPENISELLSHLNVETELTLSALYALKKEGSLETMNDLEGMEFSLVSSSELTPEIIEEARVIYLKNMQDCGYSQELQTRLLAGFEQSAKPDSQSKWYITRIQEKVESFFIFDQREKDGAGYLYAKALNISPHLKGFRFGEAIIEEALTKEIKEGEVRFECFPEKEVSARYIEQAGAIGTSYETKTGIMNMKGFPSCTTEYKTKNLKREEISELPLFENHSEQERGGDNFEEEESFRYETTNQKNIPFELVNQGYVLTRYFKKDNKWCVVFEKTS